GSFARTERTHGGLADRPYGGGDADGHGRNPAVAALIRVYRTRGGLTQRGSGGAANRHGLTEARSVARPRGGQPHRFVQLPLDRNIHFSRGNRCQGLPPRRTDECLLPHASSATTTLSRVPGPRAAARTRLAVGGRPPRRASGPGPGRAG